jgi:hypothetical protein
MHRERIAVRVHARDEKAFARGNLRLIVRLRANARRPANGTPRAEFACALPVNRERNGSCRLRRWRVRMHLVSFRLENEF